MVVLGRLVKAVGLGGEVKLLESPDFWVEALGSHRLLLEGAGARRSVQVVAERPGGPGMRVLRLEGVAGREAAQALVGSELVLELETLDVAGPAFLRPFQWRGLRVHLADGSLLGLVEDVLDSPAHDVLIVRAGGREVLVPAVPDIVKEVDLESGLVRIEPPPGLLEL